MQALTRTSPSRSESVEETRGRILAAAREIFARNGTRGTTTREVALRAGVNEATLFRHFGSKAALLSAMRQQACDTEALRESLTGTGDVAADLRRIARTAVESLHRQRDMLCISLAEETMDPPGPDTPEWRAPTRIQQLLTEYFAGLVADGKLVGQPDFLARTFMGMMFQYVVARRLWSSHVLDLTTVDALVDVFLHGVKH